MFVPCPSLGLSIGLNHILGLGWAVVVPNWGWVIFGYVTYYVFSFAYVADSAAVLDPTK